MALLPIFGLAAVMLALGARLVRSGLRVHGVEAWLGLFLVAGGVSMPVRFALANGAELAFAPGPVNFACQVVLYAGVCCLAGFIWRTFRPTGRAGRAAFLGVVVLLSVQLVLFGVTGAYALQGTSLHAVQSGTLALIFAWGFVESARYHARMQRRAALSLADPVVTNRFLLWTIWTGGLTTLPIVVTTVRVVELIASQGSEAPSGGALGSNPAWTLVVIRTTVLIAVPLIAGALWLSFFPPQGYRNWVRSRYPAQP